MAEFQFVTKPNQNPRDLQKVYFTSHPDDFDNTFDEIKKEIFSRQNVAIWYLEPGVKPEDVEDYELQLGLMNLFVVPVTAKLLTTSNRAMDTEVPFALEKHIPVLPLLQEDGLDALYSQKFGDLQYLDKNNIDPTAIPYEEKLTKYLESIIIGDELAQQIRDAFDAYIFLSYRKKDRAYAQELMKLIHRNEFMRDIAIWYDEFLTPGENFNDAIKDALEKSDLFALTVTPNLLEMPDGKPNFVMDKEYPAAKEAKKPIFAAEMSATDKEELNSKFLNIPDPVLSSDRNQMKERLYQMIQKLALASNDKDPQHNFFIGLAYLNGIDIEKNPQIAEGLITDAANQNYIPAIKKLRSMYLNGEGVDRSYYGAIECQKQLFFAQYREYSGNPNEENALALLDTMLQHGLISLDFGDFTAAFNSFDAMRKKVEDFADQYGDQRFLELEALCCRYLGDAAADAVAAFSWYERCMNLLLSEEMGKDRYKKEAAVCSFKLAEAARQTGDLLTAEQWSRTAVQSAEEIAETNNTPEARFLLSDCCLTAGEIQKEMKQYDRARYLYQKSLALSEVIAEETNAAAARRDMGVCYSGMGDIALAIHDCSEADKWYRKSYELRKKLAGETESYDDVCDYSVSCVKLGEIAEEQNDLSKAKEQYEEAYSIIIPLTKTVKIEWESDNIWKLRRAIALSCMKLGDIAQLLGDQKQAEEYYQKSKTQIEILSKWSYEAQDENLLSIINYKLSDF